MAFQNHGQNAHKQNQRSAGRAPDAGKDNGAGTADASNGDGNGHDLAGSEAQQEDASMREPVAYDPDADEKPNNGSRLHRAHDTHYDDAPGHDKALHKLEAQARQLVKPSRQGSGHTSTSVQQSTDNGQLQAGGYREQNLGDADDENTGSVPQAQNVGDKRSNKVGSKKAVAKKRVVKKTVSKPTVTKTAAAKKTVGKSVVAKKAAAKTAAAKKAVSKATVGKSAQKAGGKLLVKANG